MGGLVAYDDSSEEESIKAQPPVQLGTTDDAVFIPNGARGEAQTQSVEDARQADGNEKPLIGPTVPTSDIPVLEEEASIPATDSLSERDLLRYLTQVTHPMSSMPESPPGSPDPAANAQFRRFLELKAKGIHFNEDLARKANFRNPSLLTTMIMRAGIGDKEQYATSLPCTLWDPNVFPEWAYKEELLKSQQELREKDDINKKAFSLAGKRTIEFTSASNSGSSSRHSTPGQQSKRRKP